MLSGVIRYHPVGAGKMGSMLQAAPAGAAASLLLRAFSKHALTALVGGFDKSDMPIKGSEGLEWTLSMQAKARCSKIHPGRRSITRT